MTKPVNKIEKLIAKLCPDGVEVGELGEVCEIADNKRKPVKSGLRIPGAIPYYGANNIQDYVEGFTHDGEYVLLAEDGSADLENYSVQYATGKFWANNHVHVIRGIDEVLNRFLFHWFRNMNFVPFLSGGTRAKLTKAKMLEIKIPIPPLAIQQEIVKILDTFTTLEAELEAELEARKKQYEYYRDELLTFGEDVEWKTLGEVGKLLRGTAITAKETTDGKIPVVANAPKPIYFHSESNRGGETIVVARSGAYAGLVSFWIQPIFLTDAFSVYPDAAMLKAKFVYYLLKHKQETIHSMKKGSGVPHVRVKDFESYSIPIPPLAEQERIVAVLDKFEALVNDISVGLPAELNARRKQYEYYRGKLLTFEPLEKDHAKQ